MQQSTRDSDAQLDKQWVIGAISQLAAEDGFGALPAHAAYPCRHVGIISRPQSRSRLGLPSNRDRHVECLESGELLLELQ